MSGSDSLNVLSVFSTAFAPSGGAMLMSFFKKSCSMYVHSVLKGLFLQTAPVKFLSNKVEK